MCWFCWNCVARQKSDGVWIGNFNVKAWKTIQHILKKNRWHTILPNLGKTSTYHHVLPSPNKNKIKTEQNKLKKKMNCQLLFSLTCQERVTKVAQCSSFCLVKCRTEQARCGIKFHGASTLFWRNQVFQNYRLIPKKQIPKKSETWTQIACLAVSQSNHYTKMFSGLLWGCNWFIFIYAWFCPIRAIYLNGQKFHHFEK